MKNAGKQKTTLWKASMETSSKILLTNISSLKLQPKSSLFEPICLTQSKKLLPTKKRRNYEQKINFPKDMMN